jgi:hypothetical protein
MAKGTNLGVWLSLQNQPLGKGAGDPNMGVASNYVPPPARIYMQNWSRTQKRKDIKVAVSARHGAEEALIYDKELAKIYNVDTLVRAVERGVDMNRYEVVIKPVVFSFKVGGQTFAIPPARDSETPPPKVEVPEGAWDLFLGNYQRMRAKDKHSGAVDAVTIGAEKTALNLRWSRRINPVLRYTDDGVVTEQNEKNFGYIEFVRETVVPNKEILDKEYLLALEMIEV